MDLIQPKNFKRLLKPIRYLIITVLTMVIFPLAAMAAPPSPLDPVSPAARSIATLHNIVLFIATMVFMVVCGLLTYSLVRYRRKSDEDPEPEQIHGNATLETIWTLVPVGILVVILVLTFQTFRDIDPDRPTDMTVQVIATQWLWEVRYPDHDISTLAEMYVPVDTDVRIELTSEDVIHSFWVPQLGGKKDAVPGYLTVTWFKAEEIGEYHGHCAEYCGLGHSAMPIQVNVVDQESFDAWIASQTGEEVNTTTPADEAATGADADSEARATTD